MIYDPPEYGVIAFFSALFVLIAGFILVARRVGRVLDERHTRRWKGRR